MIKYAACSEGADTVAWFDTQAEAIEYAQKECYAGDVWEILECKLLGRVIIPEPDPIFDPCED